MRAKVGLLAKCSEQVDLHNSLPADRTENAESCRLHLTLEEYDWLLPVIDHLSLSGKFIAEPTVVFRSKKPVRVRCPVADLKRIFVGLNMLSHRCWRASGDD